MLVRFHWESVRTWFPDFEEETLTYAASIFREKTTEECTKVIVQLLLDYGLLVMGADKRIRLCPDWEKCQVFMNGNQYSVEKGSQFAAKAAASLGTYSDDYESNMNIVKAMSRILWTPGQLHVEFRMCNAIYIIHYGGFLNAFQQLLRLPVLSRIQPSASSLRRRSSGWRTIRYTVASSFTGLSMFLCSMWQSKDQVYRNVAFFLTLRSIFPLPSVCQMRRSVWL